MTRAPGRDGGGLGGRPVERGVEQHHLGRVHREDAGQVDQHEHARRDAEEPVHVDDVLDAERPGQRPDAGGQHGGADEAGDGEQTRDVRELAPHRLGRRGGQPHADRCDEDGREEREPSQTHDTLSHGRGR